MADNKDMRDGRDRSRVNSSEPYEVQILQEKFRNKSREEIVEAIKSHGPNREDIERFLAGRLT